MTEEYIINYIQFYYNFVFHFKKNCPCKREDFLYSYKNLLFYEMTSSSIKKILDWKAFYFIWNHQKIVRMLINSSTISKIIAFHESKINVLSIFILIYTKQQITQWETDLCCANFNRCALAISKNIHFQSWNVERWKTCSVHF